MSVYSSTDQINLLKNIFTPEFQFGAGGYFQPTVKTYLPGNVEIGDPTTSYSLRLNGNALATDLSIAAWSTYPATTNLGMSSNSILNVSSIQLLGGNSITTNVGTLNNISGLKSINSYPFTLSSALTFGSDKVIIGLGAGLNISGSDIIALGLSAGYGNQGTGLVAIGSNAGAGINTSGYTVAIGSRAGLSNTATGGVFVGYTAGTSNVGNNSVMIGSSAGYGNKGTDLIAIGCNAGFSNLSSEVVAIGTNACANNSGYTTIGIGYQAGRLNTGNYVVALGNQAGYSNSASGCIYIGNNSNNTYVPTVTSNTFFVYSAQPNTPFLQGDMNSNTLGIGKAPVSGVGLAVAGSIQNVYNVNNVTTSPLVLNSTNASTRFFISNVVNISFSTTNLNTGAHWIVTNISTNSFNASICGGTVFGGVNVSLAGTSSNVARSVTFAYAGSGNFYAF
jgi:hypothetical protein